MVQNKAYFCSFDGCSMTFDRPSRLQWHIRSHTGERPYKCTVGDCSKAYATSTKLKRHFKTFHKLATDNQFFTLPAADATSVNSPDGNHQNCKSNRYQDELCIEFLHRCQRGSASEELSCQTQRDGATSQLSDKSQQDGATSHLSDKRQWEDATSELSDKCQRDSATSQLTDRCQQDGATSELSGKCQREGATSQLSDKCQEEGATSELSGKCQRDGATSQLTDRCQQDGATSQLSDKCQWDGATSQLSGKSQLDGAISQLSDKCQQEDATSQHTPREEVQGYKYKCKVPGCEKSFKRRSNLYNHRVLQHEPRTSHRCQVEGCGKEFSFPNLLKRHMKSHDGYNCKQCSQVFSKWSELRKHVSNDHKKVHECSHCSKTFQRPCDLRRHELTHSGNKQIYRCMSDGCEKQYDRVATLRKHIKAQHHGELPHKCTTCIAAFPHLADLKRHSNYHKKKEVGVKKSYPAKGHRKVPLLNRLLGSPAPPIHLSTDEPPQLVISSPNKPDGLLGISNCTSTQTEDELMASIDSTQPR